jgi:tetraacyldisaccharide 4'-kinase
MLRILLIPFSWLYGIGISLRNLLYDIGLMPVFRSPVPVISVGNITVGGTGKTPFVEYLVRRYLEKGIKPCVISRGYKRLTRGMQVVSDGVNINGTALSAGDEPYQIAKKFSGAMVVVAEKRAVAADFVIKQYKPQLFILDDGFQHRSMGRDIDIVMIDGTRKLTEIHLLPAGRRRDHISSLRRADVLINTHADKNEALPFDANKIEMRYKVNRFHSLATDKSYSLEQMRGKRCVVFSGIGNPESLNSTLKEAGIEILASHEYPDHYTYREKDLDVIQRSMETTKGDFVVTTEKDAIRLESLELPPSFPIQLCLSLIIEAVIVRGEDVLSQILNEKIDQIIK